MRSQAFQRGQTLVLAALSLLLLTLLVCMTLSFGSKLKEKMEVETVADAAAYSNATVTARVFNEISLMNRGQIAEMVAMAAVQSEIDYSSYYRAQLEAMRGSYAIAAIPYVLMLLGCPFSPMCACAGASLGKIGLKQTKITTEEARISAGWDAADHAAGMQMRLIQDAATVMYAGELAEYARLELKLQNQSLVSDIVDKAKAGDPYPGEWSAPSGADSVTTREIFPFLGAVEPIDNFNDHAIAAAMGSRGYTFTRVRGTGAATALSTRLTTLVTPDVVYVEDTGGAYWADVPNKGAVFWPSGMYAWGDDAGPQFLDFNSQVAPCPPSFGLSAATSLLRATDSGDSTDLHQWAPMAATDAEPPMTRHTLGACVGSCPGMWPMFVDYNEVRVVMGGDNYGQPKNYATVVRDYSARPSPADPWDLFFRFRLTSTGAPFDDRGLVLGPEGGGVNISHQVGLSAGIAYYRRPDANWKEPPNFLNPFWRATLVPLDTDDQGQSDPDSVLSSAGAGYAKDAYDALRGVGYTGWP